MLYFGLNHRVTYEPQPGGVPTLTVTHESDADREIFDKWVNRPWTEADMMASLKNEYQISEYIERRLPEPPEPVAASSGSSAQRRVCGGCGKSGAEVKLRVCTKCNKTFYCSKVCQLGSWNQHKKECKKLVAAKPV